MKLKIRKVVAGALIGMTAAVAVPSAAQASADKCAGGNFSQSCVAVNGKNLKVNWIKSRVGPYAFKCVYGHSQVLIDGKHFADSQGGRDKDYCSPGYPGKEITTDTWNVNRSYKKGTQICSKFWVNNGGPNNGYTELGKACAKIG